MSYYAIRTEPGRLPIVRQLLRRQGHTSYLPAEVRFNHRRRKRIVVPMMPYLFIKAPAAEVQALWMQQVKATRYVKSFIGSALGEPYAIADQKIEVLRRAIKEHRFEAAAAKAKRKIKPGSKAIMKEGPFRGFKGTVTWTSGRRAKWETFLFGRHAVVEVSLQQIEAAA